MQAPWDALSQSVYGERSSVLSTGHPADAAIQNALEHREEARIRVLNALERAGATPLTIRQVPSSFGPVLICMLPHIRLPMGRVYKSTTWMRAHRALCAESEWTGRELILMCELRTKRG